MGALFGLSACVSSVAGGLTEDDANRVVVALERAGVDTTKESDPAVEGRYRVTVSRDDASRAVGVLRDDELPPRATPGVLDAVGKSSLVPSALAEHAQYVAGIAGDLERTLASVDGVLDAHVHLSLPEPDPLGETKGKATGSVLIKHRGATSPIGPGAVQHLVAGAVSGMAPDDVAVVMVERPSAPTPPERQIAHVGPLALTRGSLPALRAAAAGLALLNLSLAAGVVALWLKLRRARAEVPPPEGSA